MISTWLNWLTSGYWPLLLLAAILLAALAASDPWSKSKEGEKIRARRVLVVVFSCLTGTVLLVLQFVDADDRWLWTLSGVPPAFVVLHGLNVAVLRNPYFFQKAAAPDYSVISNAMAGIAKATYQQELKFYGTTALMIRFMVPAVLLAMVDLVVGHAVLGLEAWTEAGLSNAFAQGCCVGVLGAYIAVVLFLGGRAMRGDVTPGGTIWAAVTMIVGPLFAGSLQLLFVGKPDQEWSDLLLPFAAGFSLRFIVEFVDAAVRRTFSGRGDVGSRLVPLMRLRGITREIEDRLLEEGVTDVSLMAAANPHRLRRNTRFDKRQILAWIDEAILVTYLPTHWESLEVDGITGAIALVWYSDDAVLGGKAEQGHLAALARRNKLDADSLRDTVARMACDAQVRLVWTVMRLEDVHEENGGPA